MLKSGGSILDANPGSDLDAIQQPSLVPRLWVHRYPCLAVNPGGSSELVGRQQG